MFGRRWWLMTGVVVLGLAVATPALAQKGKGRGGGGSEPACGSGEYPATLWFGAGSAIHPAGDPEGPLYATVIDGHITGTVDVENAAGDDLPLQLNFSGAGEYPTESLDHYGATGPAQLAVDPQFKSFVYTDEITLEPLPCDMFGMELDTIYVGRIGVMWWEDDGVPVQRHQNSNGRWVLRFKPQDQFGNPPAWVHIERTANDEWQLWSRGDSVPPHHASLEKTGSGKGKKAVPTTWSKPVMPVAITIQVDCSGACPAPDSGGS